MYSIALTGSKASGKSTVANKFKDMGIPVFDHDLALKFLLNFDNDTQKRVRKTLGDNAFMSTWLNTAFFDSKEKFVDLIECAEEKSFELYFKWKKKQESKYVIFMSSLIFEQNLRKNFHSIINVYAPKDIRADRVGKMYNDYQMSFNLNTEYDELIKNQESNFIIHNYDNIDLDAQLKNINDKILNGNTVGKMVSI